MRPRSRIDKGVDRSVWRPFLAEFDAHSYTLFFGINGLANGRKWDENERFSSIFAHIRKILEGSCIAPNVLRRIGNRW